jgi:hypothetical protein
MYEFKRILDYFNKSQSELVIKLISKSSINKQNKIMNYREETQRILQTACLPEKESSNAIRDVVAMKIAFLQTGKKLALKNS